MYHWHNYDRILKYVNKRIRSGTRKSLKGKAVRLRHDPVTVSRKHSGKDAFLISQMSARTDCTVIHERWKWRNAGRSVCFNRLCPVYVMLVSAGMRWESFLFYVLLDRCVVK